MRLTPTLFCSLESSPEIRSHIRSVHRIFYFARQKKSRRGGWADQYMSHRFFCSSGLIYEEEEKMLLGIALKNEEC